MQQRMGWFEADEKEGQSALVEIPKRLLAKGVVHEVKRSEVS